MDFVLDGVLQGELFLRCGLSVTTLGFYMFRLREASSLSGMTYGVDMADWRTERV